MEEKQPEKVQQDPEDVDLEDHSSQNSSHDIIIFDDEDEEDESTMVPLDVDESSHDCYTSNKSQWAEGIECGGESRYWIPNVDEAIKPVVNTIFNTLEQGIEMYSKYANKGGFEVRKSTQKRHRDNSISHKYVWCRKAGLPQNNQFDSLTKTGNQKERNTNFTKTGCEAGVKFSNIPGTTTFKLYSFEEKHNHILIPKDKMHLTRNRRTLDYSTKIVLHSLANTNIGAIRAHNIMVQLKGGYENVVGTSVDYKNFARDRNCYVGGSDSYMMLEKMRNKEKHVPNFTFEYACQNSELKAIFWADEAAKRNYAEFGDVISFDATYETNQYFMVFVPFTRIDNHKKCVTFGTGLLCKENTENYIWLLKAFLKAFGKQPRMVVTDQDAAMNIAIEAVFTESRHRLCMWHITKKIPAKVSSKILKTTDFKKRFYRLVWDVLIGPDEFDIKWHELINDFNLSHVDWFSDIFEIRNKWIPAYFREMQMSGLMRTTSRSESENWFFSGFSHPGSTLVDFVNSFESAMEKQRYTQGVLDHKTATTTPKSKTPLPIERHACELYTRSVFFSVQKEIYESIWTCSQKSITSYDDCDVFIIRGTSTSRIRYKGRSKDKDVDYKTLFPKVDDYKVIYKRNDETVECSCMYYVHEGMLCRHIFCVFKYLGINEIPSKYVLRRWRKDIIPSEVLKKQCWYGEGNEHCRKVANDAHSTVDYCIGILVNDKEKLENFAKKMHKIRSEIEIDVQGQPSRTNNQDIESLLGISKPDEIDIHNPTGIRNKGCGTRKRSKGPMETAIVESSKPKRKCGRCHKLSTHDARNCPLNSMGK